MPTIRAAIYTRISRDSESDGLGVMRQEKDCRELAEAKGWSVERVFTDNDVSASRSKPRPQYEAMRRAVMDRAIDAVVVWDIDRLTRKPRELEDWIDFADEFDLKLASVGGEIQLSTVQGRGMARMKGTFARMEAENTARRQRRKQVELAEAGRYNGPRPFGWDFATDSDGRVLRGSHQRLVVNDGEASIVRECAERVVAGESLWSISKDLGSRGAVTATGAQWRTQTLRRMLLRPMNVGLRKHQDFKDGHYVGPEKFSTGQWAAILDEDTFDRLRAVLTDPARVTNRGDTTLKYLLTWIVECGACGGPMVGTKPYSYLVKSSYVRKDGTRAAPKERLFPSMYRCPHAGCHGVTRSMADVDEFVETFVVRLLERHGVTVFGGDSQAALKARSRIDALVKRKLLLSDLVGVPAEEGGLDPEQFRRQNLAIQREIDVQQERLRASTPGTGFDAYTGVRAGRAWARSDVRGKRRVIQALQRIMGLRIVIDPIGSGAFSGPDRSRFDGIRIESSFPGADR